MREWTILLRTGIVLMRVRVIRTRKGTVVRMGNAEARVRSLAGIGSAGTGVRDGTREGDLAGVGMPKPV